MPGVAEHVASRPPTPPSKRATRIPCENPYLPPQKRSAEDGPPGPTFRANPFPEVTDPFCRLPLSALFYSTRGCSPRRPAAVIGTARLHVLISPSGFQGSAATHRMPRTKRGTLPVVPPYLRANRFQGRSDCQEEKTTLPGMAVDVPELDRVTACTGVRVQEFSPGSLSARGADRTVNRPKLPSDGVDPCLRTD